MILSSFLTVHLTAGKASGDHAHDATELVCIDGCDGYVWFGDRKRAYREGDLLVHPARSRHRASNRQAGRHHCLGLKGPELSGLGEGIVHGGPGLLRLFRGMSEELAARRPQFRPIIEAMAQEALHRVLRLQEEVAQPLEKKLPADESPLKGTLSLQTMGGSPKLEAVRRRLEDAVGERIDLGTLSGELLLSKDYLRHAFKKEYGLSPMQYLIRKRIDVAKVLLDTSPLKSREIAERCGFENEFYFSRLFRQVAGMPPTDWRKRHVRGGEEQR
ncbi:MAG: helix-turn-helix domain-containing protein [Spirochaetes bacterium]|nr:helix-turn-helix domain-containing protein [Spirochaetota bacterium]